MNILKVNNSIEIHDVEDLKKYHSSIQSDIRLRLKEFRDLGKSAKSFDIFQELAFCILTANASAKMALKSINKLENTIFNGSEKDIENGLRGVYRFPKTRASYIYRTRIFLESNCELDIRKIFNRYDDQLDLREFLTQNVIGIGFKECSHFLRNVGYSGLAILDKHIVSMLNLLGCSIRKPKNRREYREIEKIMIDFSKRIQIDIDELDLLLWSYKTGELIK